MIFYILFSNSKFYIISKITYIEFYISRTRSCCGVCFDFRIKTMSVSSFPQVACRSAHVLCTLFVVCLRIVVSNKYCVVVLFLLYQLCCQFLWIVHFFISSLQLAIHYTLWRGYIYIYIYINV